MCHTKGCFRIGTTKHRKKVSFKYVLCTSGGYFINGGAVFQLVIFFKLDRINLLFYEFLFYRPIFFLLRLLRFLNKLSNVYGFYLYGLWVKCCYMVLFTIRRIVNCKVVRTTSHH